MNVVAAEQKVFFVRRAERAEADDRGFDPVVLIDPALHHLHPEAIELTVVDGPTAGARATSCIDSRELALYPGARYAVIVNDRRHGGSDA